MICCRSLVYLVRAYDLQMPFAFLNHSRDYMGNEYGVSMIAMENPTSERHACIVAQKMITFEGQLCAYQ